MLRVYINNLPQRADGRLVAEWLQGKGITAQAVHIHPGNDRLTSCYAHLDSNVHCEPPPPPVLPQAKVPAPPPAKPLPKPPAPPPPLSPEELAAREAKRQAMFTVLGELCRRVFGKESLTATMAQHIGSCRGRGRANHAYHGYTLGPGGDLILLTRVPCLSGEAGVAGLQEFEGFRLCMSTARLGTCLLEPCCMYTVSFGACLLFEVSHVYFLCFGMFSNICQPRPRSRQWTRGLSLGLPREPPQAGEGRPPRRHSQNYFSRGSCVLLCAMFTVC